MEPAEADAAMLEVMWPQMRDATAANVAGAAVPPS